MHRTSILPGCAGLLFALALIALPALSRAALANGSDLPAAIVLPAYLAQDGDRLHLIVRVPLVLLTSFAFPRRGPGYLDLAHLDPKLREAAVATGRQIEVAEDGVSLKPVVVKARVSPLADRSFTDHAHAKALVEGPPLPPETDLFWDQGFFDTELDYTLHATSAALSLRVNVAPELGRRLALRLQFLPAAGAARTYDLPGGTGWVPLTPQWFEAVWTFVRTGFVNAFGRERLVFLLCLVAPFIRFRSVVAVILAMAAAQAITLTAVAEGAVAERPWLPAIVASVTCVVSLLLAIGNLGSPSLRRRWLVAALVGGLAGFGLGGVLAGQFQFAGEHPFVAMLSYNAGVVFGEVVALAIAFVALRALFATAFGATVGVIIVSALLALLAWQWTADAKHELVHELGHAASEGILGAAPLVLWMLPPLAVGAIAWFLPRTFGGVRVESLRDALFGRVRERNRNLG